MTTKRTLLTSAVSLVLCICMLLGTTFAWFTDAVTSSGNIIASGKLDAEMYWSDKLLAADSDEWNNADGTSVFNYNNWEPGYTEVRYVKVSNAGTLNFRWKLSIEAEGNVTDLSDVINVYYVNPVTAELTKEGLKSLTPAGTLTDVLENNTGLDGRQLTPDSSVILAIAFHMDELAGNDYQNKSLCDAGFSLKLLATQDIGESDSFGDDYDGNAFADIFAGFQGGSAGAAVTTNDEGATTSAVSMSGGDVSAEVPAGVKVADGVKSLELVVSMMDASGANIQLGATEAMQSLDVHMEGVAEGNTIPMLITLREYLPTGFNTGALKLYHVENGETVVMTQVDNPTNHNEFSYDPATGDVTLAMASFSEVAVVADTTNPWDGEKLNYLWYDASATELTIYNADQLAAFATIVDGTAEGIAQDSFEGKTVKLGNNIYLSGKLFEPIGWGYADTQWNSGSAEGKVFKGTFDGGEYDDNGNLVGRYTIFDLHQSGWDLEEKTGTDYTYTNCGFGLFAAASNATFKNLTISGAYVRVECVEAGVLVGLSQNDCTYENIKIYNSKIANYQRPAGGLIGEVSGDGTTKITNVTIGSDVVVGSLWGDFDAPVGGVIGARWDDAGKNPQIKMKYVDVSCRLDVYNDVTSAYQWHAYRRAGMLIGNTDTPAANGKVAQIATAGFLECIQDDGEDTVIVRLGSWADYTYCQFTNEENPGRNYPWVRVQAGENNSAYSNPRYGHPVDANGNVVDGSGEHKHAEGDICGMTIAFAQLYGGGQGVYGATNHPGVTMENYRYSIIYVNNDAVLSIQYVTEDMAQQTKPFIPNDEIAKDAAESWVKAQGYGNVVFDCWVTAGSKKAEIPADNTENITVYPSFTTPYTARFVDLDGNVLEWCFFNKTQSNIVATEQKAKELLPPQDESIVKFSNWEVHYYDNNGDVVTEVYNSANFTGDHYTTDVTIYPVYTYTGGLNLEPVDSDGDGKTNYYKVVATKKLDANVTIPGEVLGIPVLVVEKLYKQEGNTDYSSGVVTVEIQEGVERLEHNAISHTAKLESVSLPSTLKYLGKNAFSRNNWFGGIVGGDTDKKVLTIVYNGTMADWRTLIASSHDEWANGLDEGSVVQCSDGKFVLTADRAFGVAYRWYWKEYSN